MARRRRRRSRNPIASRSVTFRRALSNPIAVVKPAIVGAAGALMVNGVVNYAPIPDNWKAGNMLFLTKAGLALALGTIGPKLPIIGRFAGKMAEGALTVVMTDLGKQLALSAGYNLSGVGYANPAMIMNQGNVRALRGPGGPGMNMYVNGRQGMQMYVQGRRR